MQASYQSGSFLQGAAALCGGRAVPLARAVLALTLGVWPAADYARVAAVDLPRQRAVSRHGVTWTFERAAPVGQFVNGDYYVAGPVRVVKIDPPLLRGGEVPAAEVGERERKRIGNGQYVRNGSMLNPPARQAVAFDSAVRNYFRPELLAVPPIDLAPGDALVSSISLKLGEQPDYPYHPGVGREGHLDDSPVRTVSILTCLGAAQPADAFRPGYADRGQTIHLGRQVRRELLLRLRRPSNTPDFGTWVRVFERPWFNPGFFGFEQPMENMPRYGQWVGQAQSMAGLMLMLEVEPEQKERLLINVIQVGLDYWALVRNGHPGWQGWGGHGSGRKFPIVLAGLLLGDEAMASPTRSFPKIEFGEDNQTMYGQGWTGANALFAGHSGILSATAKPERPHWGPYEHLPPAEWRPSQRQSEAYRRANTSSSWVGQALVIRLLKAETQWNHDAFLDYVDRWMSEDDREHRAEIIRHHPTFRAGDQDRWTHQGFTWEPFVKSMWDQYRPRAERESLQVR